MENKNMNINLLLCEKADDQVRNINNIFDKIIFTNRNKNISFEILTIINQLDEESKENKVKQIIDTSLEFKDVSIKMSNSEILSNISFKISRRRKCLLGRKQWKWKKYINKGLVRLFGL